MLELKISYNTSKALDFVALCPAQKDELDDVLILRDMCETDRTLSTERE